MRYQDVWDLYEDGDLQDVIDQMPVLEALDTIHEAMYENALDEGIEKEQIARVIQDVNYEMGRKHRLDEREVSYMTRMSMAQMDKEVALDIMRAQIMGIAKMIDEYLNG